MSKKNRYTPILRWKQNERIALRNLSVAGRVGVSPLVVLLQGQYGDTKPPRAPPKKLPKKAPPTAAEAFTKQLLDAWGTSSILLDASNLLGTASAHHLDDIAAAARAAGLSVIPATIRTATPEYQAAVKRMLKADGRGVALRVTLPEMASASTWAGSWLCALTDTDLIIDLAGGVSAIAAIGVSVAPAFASLHKGIDWRSVTIAGGCIPATLTTFDLGATTIPRDEFKLWRLLSTQGLPYRIDFGDYGSISPDAPTRNIPAAVPINAKYSLSDKFLVFRGVKITGPGAIPMDRQLRKYATAIVAHPARGVLAHCWADDRIDKMAASSGVSVGNPGVWIGLNMNRHIEITRHALP